MSTKPNDNHLRALLMEFARDEVIEWMKINSGIPTGEAKTLHDVLSALLVGAREQGERKTAIYGGSWPWLPISTAPRDGRLVDLYYPKIGRVCDCWWGNQIDGKTYAWLRRHDDDGMLGTHPNLDPTHWMTRPQNPPPKS